MADIYVRSSDGDDGDDGSTWALAKATYQAAATAAGTDGTVYMDEDHRETFGISIVFAIPSGLETIVVQTDTTTLVTSPNATANLETTTSNDDIDLDVTDIGCYFWGLSIRAYRHLLLVGFGDSFTFEKCRLENNPAGARDLTYQTDSIRCELKDCELGIGGITSAKGSKTYIVGCTFLATGPTATNLFDWGTEGGTIFASGNDFSAYAGTNIFGFADLASADMNANVEFYNNIMPSSFSWSSGRPTIRLNDGNLIAHANGSADEYYQIYEENYGGYVQESVAIDRVGGATYDGTNLFSVGLHGNANTSYVAPIRHKLRTKPIDASSGATVKVHLAYDKATTLNNSDIGLELKYHDGTNEAHGKWVREIALGPLDSGDRNGFTDVSVSETWNQSFSNANEETIEVDIPTGQGNGLVEVWVVLMSNETVYFCPEIEVS